MTQDRVIIPTHKLTPTQRREVYASYVSFVDEDPDPHDAAFVAIDFVAKKYLVTKEDLQTWPEFALLRRRAVAKQELYWREKGKNGQATAMSIFVLKQPDIGYRDRIEQDVTSGGEKFKFISTVPKPMKTKKADAEVTLAGDLESK